MDTQLLILAIGALGFGMYLLFKGGDWTIDAAVFIARKFGISPLVIGFTIVAFGTSLPELLVSVNANLAGSPGIAIGNVIGSNIANILFVIGATASVATLVAVRKAILRDVVMMMMATVLMMYFMMSGAITQGAGMLMIAVLAFYVIWQYWAASKGKIEIEAPDAPEFKNMFMAALFLALGLASIALGAEFLVRGAKTAASIIGVPEDVIGLSVIAIGTSLPELSTCLIAAMKKQTDIIVGNILGSNVFNILMIMGVTSIVKPIDNSAIAEQVVKLDIWVMFGVSALFSTLLLIFGKINRPMGILFLIGYVFYIGLIYALYLSSDMPMLAS
ncbi:MAG: sodium transporter [Micavibrio sp.]|nr:sodium transporter [Micavibrio sp.]|tara:strand:+ start:93 stop:1085 length:993 start_codon:yes stop_codon:yes gene_type:complete